MRQVRGEVPRVLERLVSRSMEKNPSRRYTTPRELAQALREAVPEAFQSPARPAPPQPLAEPAPQPAPAPKAQKRPATPPKPPRPKRRRTSRRWFAFPVAAAAAAIVVVAATAAVSYFGVLGDQAKETVDGRIDSIRDAAGALVPEGGFDCYNARSDEDIVQVISIDPPPGTVLEAGQIIDIAATVRYELDSHDTAEVELYYLLPPEREGDRYSGGSAGFAKREISGRGTVNLRGSFEVPDIPDTEIAVHLQPTLDDVRADGFDCWSSMDRAFAATYYVGDGSEIVEVREAQGSNETPGSVRRTVFTSLGGVNRAIAAVSDVVVASPELSEAEALFPGNGHYYQVVRRKDIGWEEARRAAERMVINGVRGHLATITSREETDWIAQNTDSGSGDLWIGGIQNSDNDSSDNDWRWVTGEKWSFTNWASGEPNDDPDDERFLEIDTTSGEWNDLNGVNGGFVVEFPFGDPVVAVQQLVPPQLRDDRFIECIVGLLGEERIREIAAAGNEPSEEEGRLIRLSCDETVAFQPNGEALVYNVAARIDGTSVLIIKGDDVQWFHANDAAPGRHDFANEPTFINGTEWMPEWPDEPDAENRDCQCYSSKLKEAIPELDLENTNVRIEVHQARGDVSFSEEDDDTLMVKFNDHPSGSDWYEISIIVEPGDGRQAVRRISNSGMRRGATVSGTVTDEDTGLPIAGISMRARPFHDDGPEPPDTETDSEGRYTLAGLSPGTYVIRARDFRRGYILEFFHDSPRADLGDPITVDVAEAIDGIDFELKLGAIVSGQVVDADTGEPINEAQIFASHTDGRGSAWTNTNSSGRYTLRGVPSGEVDIRAQAHGYIQEHVKLQVEGTERVTGTDFDLGIGASISGRVVDAETGQPVSRVYVFADTHSGNGGGNGSDTDFDGRYEISGLAPGTYYVKAEGDRHGYMRVYYGGAQDSNEAEPVRVEASSQVAGIDFQLEQGATIVGRVVDDQSGLPIVNIEVYAGPQNRGHSSWSRTDGNGEYILRGLPAGVMEVGARGLDYIERSLTVVTTDNQPATASDLRLEVGTTISGRVTDEATGRPIANVNIEANRDGGGSSSWANTDRDGRYVVRGIGPGTYRIQAQANEEGYVQEVYDDTFSWDDAREITIKSKEGVGGIDFALAMGGLHLRQDSRRRDGRAHNQRGDLCRTAGRQPDVLDQDRRQRQLHLEGPSRRRDGSRRPGPGLRGGAPEGRNERQPGNHRTGRQVGCGRNDLRPSDGRGYRTSHRQRPDRSQLRQRRIQLVGQHGRGGTVRTQRSRAGYVPHQGPGRQRRLYPGALRRYSQLG